MGHRLKRTLIIYACIAQLVERSLGKAEVTGSTPVISSTKPALESCFSNAGFVFPFFKYALN